MLSRPRMCDGGVATWMRSRSVSCSASRQCPTAASSDAWVCRTAFGRPVVPELNTSTASPSAGIAPDAGSPAPIGSSRCSIGIRPSSTGWSPAAWAGLVSARAWSTSPRFQAGLSSTAVAPSRQIARSRATNSGRLDAITATRWPAVTPRLVSVVASPPANASSSSRLNRRSSNASAAGSVTSHSSPAVLRRPYQLWRIVFSIRKNAIREGLIVEHVAAATPDAADRTATPGTVTIHLERKKVTVPLMPGETLLESARRAGLDPPFNCEAGNCGTCMARLEEGHATMRVNDALEDDEVAEGYILTCQGVPDTASITVRYE